MYDELQLKFLINQRVEQYNNDQKSLHFNRYVLKIVQILILLILIGALGTFAFSLTTPYFLKAGLLSDAMAIMFSGCLISLIIGGLIFFLFFRKIKKSSKKPEVKIHSYDAEKAREEAPATDANITSDKLLAQKMAPTVERKTFLGRLLSVFTLLKDLFTLFFGDMVTLSQPPDRIYFDTNKMDFAIWLLIEVERHKNYCMSFSFIEDSYKDVSSRWVTNTISELEKIKVVRALQDDNNRDVVVLNLDFYTPQEMI